MALARTLKGNNASCVLRWHCAKCSTQRAGLLGSVLSSCTSYRAVHSPGPSAGIERWRAPPLPTHACTRHQCRWPIGYLPDAVIVPGGKWMKV